MAISKLNLEDFCNEVFSLFAIHTDLDDYRLAYFLNKHLGINLFRKTFDLDFVNSKGSFSVFEYIDQTNFLKWSLISNIYNYNFSAKASNDDLFVESNNLVQKVNLLAEYKNVNYLLKIENNESQVDLEDIAKEIKSISQVITLYDINKDLKNKENLIFL
ncbi:MAG: IPExxxVDY family protein [Flavobacteriaceae bacterium]|nr:IPExxxVDY family protein [Flavobacteriaceae bacterium]